MPATAWWRWPAGRSTARRSRPAPTSRRWALPRAAEAILSLMPLDTFVPAPVVRMSVVGDPNRVLPVHERL